MSTIFYAPPQLDRCTYRLAQLVAAEQAVPATHSHFADSMSAAARLEMVTSRWSTYRDRRNGSYRTVWLGLLSGVRLGLGYFAVAIDETAASVSWGSSIIDAAMADPVYGCGTSADRCLSDYYWVLSYVCWAVAHVDDIPTLKEIPQL